MFPHKYASSHNDTDHVLNTMHEIMVFVKDAIFTSLLIKLAT